ncbi:MAG TPA: 1-acyl-sn-glycerol-3-phosphate acyltransferase [Cytophagales bacterium]|nr:1-acyl-sn-glycerol-3-phosphate acyltransferase [Cytophagales bacterium]
MSGLFLSLYTFFRNHRLIFIGFILGVLSLAGFFALNLKFEEDITKVMPSDAKIEKLNFVFRNSKFLDRLVITISAADTNAQANPEALMAAADQLTDSISQKLKPELISEISAKVSDDLMYEVYNTFYQNLPIFLDSSDYNQIDERISEEGVNISIQNAYKTLMSPASFVLKKFLIRDPLSITPLALNKLQSLRIDDNHILQNGYILTKDQKHLLLFVTPAHENNETAKNGEMLDKLDEIIEQISAKNKEIHAEYYGAVAVAVGNAERIKKDVNLTVTISLLVIMMFISFFFKNKSIFFFMFVPVLFGGLISLAVLTILKGTVSVISLGIGCVVLGVTVDYAIHAFSHFRSTGSIKDVIKDLSVPIIMSCITTSAAFLCLVFVKAEAIQDLGLFAAFNVIGAAIFAVVVLPHLLGLMKNKIKKGEVVESTFIDKISSYRFENNRWVILSLIILTIVFYFTSSNVELESDMMKMNYMSDKLRQSEENLNKISDTSLKSVYLISNGKDLKEALKKNEEVTQKLSQLKAQDVIKNYSSISALLISDSVQQARIDMWENYWTPEKKALVQERLTQTSARFKFKPEAFKDFYGVLNTEFQPVDLNAFGDLRKQFLNDYITEEKGQTSIITIAKVSRENKDEVYKAINENHSLVMFDKEYLTTRFVDLLNNEYNNLLNISLLLVFMILILSYGRLELGLISFVPIILSWVWTLGLMGIFGVKFNIVNIIISSLIFGLGVDYSIFIKHGLLQEYKYGIKNLPAYKTSIFISAVTTIIGTGALIFAKHPALKSIAALSLLGLFSLIAISYTVEPILFRWLVYKKGDIKRQEPLTLGDILGSLISLTFFLLGCLIMSVGIFLYKILLLPKKYGKAFFHKVLMYVCRFIIYVMVNVRKRIINEGKEDFKKPALIIANHQSHIDLLLILMMYPKIIVLTNEWVWKNPLFGHIVRYLDFYPNYSGVEMGLEKFEEKVKEGYSILIYPEGSRSEDSKIRRFHKGAFFLAEKLNLDVLPVLLHGVGDTMAKGEQFLRSGNITVKILPRIKPEDTSFGTDYSDRTKAISKHFKNEFEKLREEVETPEFFKRKLIKNYLYKGPVIEWYMKVKIRLDGYYRMFHENTPKHGKIVDIGCGYGFMSYMLHFLSKEREILGIDYDEEKINVANNCVAKNENINFVSADITQFDLPEADTFIISDVLHYLKPEAQDNLIYRCLEKLNDGGTLIIRDGNSEMKERHKGTKLTEFFSTNFGFNKTVNELHFTSKSKIMEILSKHKVKVEVIDDTRLTSNIVFVIKKHKESTIAA